MGTIIEEETAPEAPEKECDSSKIVKEEQITDEPKNEHPPVATVTRTF